MLFDKRELSGIEAGEISLVFRTWRGPRVRVGTKLRTSIGLVEVVDLIQVDVVEVTDDEAQSAGFADRSAFEGWLDDRPGELYRIGVRHAGPDPRVALRARAEMTPGEIAELAARLDRMDARAERPWTRETLRLIRDNPSRVSTELAEAMGLERKYFKNRVRRLKELGLTENLEVGYRISPRGEALLWALESDSAWET